MSHTTRFKAELRELARQGIDPNGPEGVAIAERFAKHRLVHGGPHRMPDAGQAVQHAVRAQLVRANTPASAREAAGVILHALKASTIAAAYLAVLPFGNAWRKWRSWRKRAAPAGE